MADSKSNKMKEKNKTIIYTIGHSTHTMEDFLEMLKSFEIESLVDVRSMPGSNKFPQFNKENLMKVLPENGIEYRHMTQLGGRRKTHKDSKNTRWRNASFRSYADYMETDEFKTGIAELTQLAKTKTTAYMCAEAVWWRCHRSMISDYLKLIDWNVEHIMGIGKVTEHSYTQPARIEKGELCYYDENPEDKELVNSDKTN